VVPNVTRAWELSNSDPLYRVELVAGQHQSFSNACRWVELVPTWPQELQDLAGPFLTSQAASGCGEGIMDIDRAQDLTNTFAISFLESIFRDGEMMGGGSRPDMLSAMVSFDLPLFRANRQDREVAAARAETRALHEMHDDHQREMFAMLTEAWAVADRTAALERFYETELLPLAEQSVQAALLAYRANRAMIDEVIAARRTVLETSLKHLRLAADRAQAQYDVEYLTGGDVNAQ
jgi:hypothetical protein